ncbi:PREDICTED: deoxynucleoside triphosphate triphosphohydrolase SAMHD1-like, partial [Amphimedon queenslandica]|uniref:HD domain-containing protein n=1 Tax=Amphimedon queenslandica TaxID=400682 RepID=A0AAN0JLN1_AMPQE
MATGPPVRSEPELDPPVEFGTIMDPVHGSIQLDKYLFKIIDRPEFQRLRKIKQFAGVYYVYPGGVHTRFEHSIGVCYIAGKLVDALNEHPRPTKTDKRLWITKEEKICIQIAALCHDIGHGSFSHLYDFAVEEKLSDDEKKNELSPHEYRSAEIIKNMMNSNLIKELRKFKGSVEAFTSDEEYFKLVKRIITFDKDCKKLPKAISKRKEEIRKLVDVFGEEKSYLFEIVANGFTGIDVDKMDYFARDARGVGLPNNFDWRWYTQTAKILECDDGFHHICSREKDALNLYELFHTRNLLHRTVYWHKTVAVIQEMMLLALVEANKYIQVNGRPLLECWEDKESFQLLDDTIEDFIVKKTENRDGKIQIAMHAVDGANDTARDYFLKIKERKIWKFVGRQQNPKEEDIAICVADQQNPKEKDIAIHVTDQQNPKEEDIAIRVTDQQNPKEEIIAICVAENEISRKKIKDNLKSIKTKFNYGMGEDDPIQFHYFYGKMYPTHPFHLDKDE